MSLELPTKVTAAHLARRAYLYIRQSTPRQVLTNTESGARQYALRQRAVALGWAGDQVVVIDCDQGQSGASAADREGFQRLAAEVGMGRAGIVLGLEVSRLARNNADWHRLLELCGLGNTLICDEDGLYDPCDFNDRLLLGLKGTMSEAELHVLRSRMRGGLLSKARRGELAVPLPVGFVHDPDGAIVIDPDAAVVSAVAHLFATFARTGSARTVVKAFAAEGLAFPTRVRSGASKGEVTWAPLEHARVVSVLHNPHYAGAYFYGRSHSRPGPDARVVTTQRAREQWLVFIPGAHPGYIDWETFEANQAKLAANVWSPGADRSAGPAREGIALLQGLAICARCGRRMRVGYHLRGGVERPTYLCSFDSQQKGAPLCQSIPGSAVDSAVAELALEALTPLALEAALSVQAEIQSRAAEADALRRRHVEAARYRADLARRRYLGVDPANRLVADTLEGDWNEALAALNDAQDTYERASAAAGAALSDEQIARVRALAGDVPALWSNPATPQRERKRMIRLLIDDVTLSKTDAVHVHIRFRGGQTASLSLPLPVPAYELRRTPPDTLALIDRLLDDHTDGEVAELLNRDGHRSGTGASFDAKKIIGLRRANGLASHAERLRAKGLVSRSEIAAAFGVSPSTISKWRARDLLVAYRANDHNDTLYDLPAGADLATLGQQLRRPPGAGLGAPLAGGGA